MKEIAKTKWNDLTGSAAADFSEGGGFTAEERLKFYADEFDIDSNIYNILSVKIIYIGTGNVILEFSCTDKESLTITKFQKSELEEDFFKRFDSIEIILST